MMSDRLKSPPIRPQMRCTVAAIRALRVVGTSVVLYALSLVLLAAFLPSPPASAQPPQIRAPRRATGTLRVIILNAVTNAPVPNIGVRTDSEEERPRSSLTGADGVAILRLFAGTYAIVLNGAVSGFETREEFTTKGRREGIVIREDQLTTITFFLDERVIDENIRRRVELVNRNETGEVTRRVRQDFFDYPLGAANRQSLAKITRSVAGFVNDAVEQTHVRGENSVNKVTFLDGILLPPTPAGALVPYIIPDSLEAFNARVGGLSAQYGGGSGAVLELESRQVRPQKPFIEFAYRNGDNNTNEIYGNFGGSFPKVGKSSSGFIKGMDYTVTLSQRYTDQGTEQPQDVYANGSNFLDSENLFAKLNFDIGKNRSGQDRKISTFFNFSSGRSGIAARTGLNDGFASYGAGYGFLGKFNRSDIVQSQDVLGQDFSQKDNNNLIAIQFKSSEPDPTDITRQRQVDRGVFSVGYSSNTRTVFNRGGTPLATQGQLPDNNSIEYLPSVLNDYEQYFIQGDWTPRPSGRNQFKFGLVYQGIIGEDSLQLIPQSQLAVDQLFQLDPRLAPEGKIVPGARDALGNPVYKLSGNNPQTPIMFTDKDGYYAAAYAQDSFRIRPDFRINIGLRVDTYAQELKTFSSLDSVERKLPNSSATALSPRLNMVLKLPENGPLKFMNFITRQPTLVRASYNRIFTPPHLNQGVFLFAQQGNNYLDPSSPVQFADTPQPQISDQFDVSVERQMSDNSILKIGAYTKSINHTLATRQILSSLQSDLLSVYDVGKTNVSGVELSFQILPPPAGEAGFHGFLSYANSASAPGKDNQLDNTGQPIVNSYNEYDQTNTLTTGVAYAFRSGASIGLSYYYGDGLYSSKTQLLFVPIRSGDRQTVSEFNLRLATPPGLVKGRLGAEFIVYNLFDSRSRLEWAGPYGTRYQPGRQVYVAVTGRF